MHAVFHCSQYVILQLLCCMVSYCMYTSAFCTCMCVNVHVHVQYAHIYFLVISIEG